MLKTPPSEQLIGPPAIMTPPSEAMLPPFGYKPPPLPKPPKEIQFTGPEFKEVFGVKLPVGWSASYIWDETDTAPTITVYAPGGVRVGLEDIGILPTGEWTYGEGFAAYEAKLWAERGEYLRRIPTIGFERGLTPEQRAEEEEARQYQAWLKLESVLSEVFITDAKVAEALALANEDPHAFLDTIVAIGRSDATEDLLLKMGLTEEEVDMVFREVATAPKLPAKEPSAVFLPLVGQIKQLSAEEKEAAPKWVKTFASGMGDVYSSAAGAARWLGYEGIGEGLSKEAERMHREYTFPDTMGDFEFADLMNPDFYLEKVVRTIPFALSLAPLAVGGYFAGAAIATAAGLGTIWATIIGGITGGVLSRPLESAMEAGSQYDDAIARGKTEKEAKEEADEVFRNNMTLAGMDAFEIAIALAPTPKWVPTSLIKGGLVRTARIGGKMVIVGLSEGGEEIYQDMIQRHARGEEWKWDPISKEVFAIGMVMGMGMGLGGDVISSIVNRSKDNMSPSLKKDFDRITAELKKEGFLPEQAELRALDIIARTPEGEKIVADAIQAAKEEPVVPEGVKPFTAEEISEIESIAADVRLLAEERRALKAITTEGSIVKHMSEGWSGIVVRPAKDPHGKGMDAKILVRHEFEGRLAERWYRALDFESGLAKDIQELIEPSIPAEFPSVALPKPPAVEEIPERAVYTEGGVPVGPDEPIPQSVVDSIPIIQDIGIKERWFRPTRKVFERMGLYETYKGIQKAEVELGEAKKAFGEKLKAVSKTVDKSRRYLMFRELENPGSQVGLTFDEKRAVNFFRMNFNKWADELNLSQEKRLKNYITHIFEADITEQLKAKHPLDPSIARALEGRAPKTIFNPFLQKRLGATVGLIEDPFAAALAYESRQLKVFYYEPMLQKIEAIANDINTPQIARDYLIDFSRRMTKQPSKLDQSINNTLQEFAAKIEKLPGGKPFASFLSRGNPSGMAAYNFTSAIYVLWLGFKPTSAIRNLSQHTLIIGEVGPISFAEGIGLRLTTEGRDAVNNHSFVWRSRKAAFVPGIDDSFASVWSDKFREAALWMFRKADEQNVKDAFLAGYSEAKRLLPDADRQVWYDRGDEVAADTQYLYTQMNSMAISQSSAGRVFSILTTWSENWLELMAKWFTMRPSQVYLQYQRETGKAVPKKNWSQSLKAILMYMAIIGLGYALKEEERLKAWEYTGITSIRYLADVVGGDFPGLQGPGAIANMIAGFIVDDDRMFKQGWYDFKGTFTPGIVRQIEAVARGDKDWLTLFFYLEGRDFHIKKLKSKWEKGWDEYNALATAQERDDYRENNPLIEAQMFITSKFTTLTTDAARAEVLRLIEKHDLDVEFIDGYDKIFGVDTNEKFTEYKKQLGQVELTEEGEQKLKENGELDYYTTSNFASDVNELVGVVGRTKVEKDGNPLAIEYLRAKDLFVQYESLTSSEARTLFRQQFPDVEAQLYLWGKITTFKNPKSAEILLELMDKYGIPPESVPAFLDNPEKYDELLTPLYDLKKKTFDLDTEYENYGNPESTLYIEDDDVRSEARDKLKADNPEWVDNLRRIEAIGLDASAEIIENYVEYGRIIDATSPSSSGAKLFRLEHPEFNNWGMENYGWESTKDWKGTTYLELATKWADMDARYDAIETTVGRELFLDVYGEYHKSRRHRDALNLEIPEDEIETYIDWYTTKRSGYEDDWYLMEHKDFYQTMVDKELWKPRDFSKVPTREVLELYEKWQKLPLGQVRRDFEAEHPELDQWLHLTKGTKLETERTRRLLRGERLYKQYADPMTHQELEAEVGRLVSEEGFLLVPGGISHGVYEKADKSHNVEIYDLIKGEDNFYIGRSLETGEVWMFAREKLKFETIPPPLPWHEYEERGVIPYLPELYEGREY